MKPNKFVLILLMVGGVFLIVIGVYSFTMPFWFQLGSTVVYVPYVILVGGFILLFGSPIVFAVKSQRQKKLDSMSQSDLVNMFTCPSSGNKGAIYLIKLEKHQILVKLKCPNHSGRRLRIPLRLKDQSISYFRDAVFRCYECGQKATVDRVKFSGPWALIKLSCPTHGNKLRTHKIWSTVYSDISKGVETTP